VSLYIPAAPSKEETFNAPKAFSKSVPDFSD